MFVPLQLLGVAAGIILLVIGAYIPVRAHANHTRDATRIVIASLGLITLGTSVICYSLSVFVELSYCAGALGLGSLVYLKYDYPSDDKVNYSTLNARRS